MDKAFDGRVVYLVLRGVCVCVCNELFAGSGRQTLVSMYFYHYLSFTISSDSELLDKEIILIFNNGV